jgi:methylated-DNA-protein-cysteine methyltransferase-like protein
VSARDAVFGVVRTIPRGKVLSYGGVAELVEGVYVSARTVGQIMASASPDVPWQRVVARDGELVIARRSPVMAAEQRRLLLIEGIGFSSEGKVRMAEYAWVPGGTLFDDE